MLHRHAISDEDWARIKDLLPGQPGQHGKVARDNRLFIDAVLWIARTGARGGTCPSTRQLELELSAVRPLGPQGDVAAAVERPAGPRSGMADLGLDHHSGPPLRPPAQKKSDGTGGQVDQALGRAGAGSGRRSTARSAVWGCPPA